MEFIGVGSFFYTMACIFVCEGATNDLTWAIIVGLLLITVATITQFFGLAKLENRLANMREEYIDLFNHSDEWSTSYDHPEMFKDVEDKTIEKIDTLNGKENN